MDESIKKRRIGNIQGVLMIGVAFAIDGVQVLLDMMLIGIILGSFISIFAWLMFWFWFRINGVGFLKGKTALLRLGALGIAGIIEIIPLINDVPAWAFAVGIMLVIVAVEDKVQDSVVLNMPGIRTALGQKTKKEKSKNARIKRRSKQLSTV